MRGKEGKQVRETKGELQQQKQGEEKDTKRNNKKVRQTKKEVKKKTSISLIMKTERAKNVTNGRTNDGRLKRELQEK